MSRLISQIEIKNFQSHVHSVLDVSPGINLIIGTSNAGKSAINRAINWALSNKPRGDYFIRKGKPFASVKITYNDGAELLRFRGIEENFVQITYSNGKVEKYEKFGNDYPAEVKKFLSIPRENKILENIYYAEQMNPLFLVNLTSADLPRAIGYLAGSDVMEGAVNLMMAESRQTKREIDKVKKDCFKTEKELESYKDVESKLERLEEVKEKLLLLQERQALLKDIESYISKEQEIIENATKTKNEIKKINKFLTVQNNIEEIHQKLQHYHELNAISQLRSSYETDLSDLNQKSQHIRAFFKIYKENTLTSLKDKLNSYKDLAAFSESSLQSKESIEEIIAEIDSIELENSKMLDFIEKNKKQLLEQKFICKECGQKL